MCNIRRPDGLLVSVLSRGVEQSACPITEFLKTSTKRLTASYHTFRHKPSQDPMQSANKRRQCKSNSLCLSQIFTYFTKKAKRTTLDLSHVSKKSDSTQSQVHVLDLLHDENIDDIMSGMSTQHSEYTASESGDYIQHIQILEAFDLATQSTNSS